MNVRVHVVNDGWGRVLWIEVDKCVPPDLRARSPFLPGSPVWIFNVNLLSAFILFFLSIFLHLHLPVAQVPMSLFYPVPAIFAP